jgi:hypothetical protein
MSPFRYQKSRRLQQARRHLIADGTPPGPVTPWATRALRSSAVSTPVLSIADKRSHCMSLNCCRKRLSHERCGLPDWAADLRQKAAVGRVLGQQATTQEGRLRAIWPFVDLKKCPANGSAIQNGLTMAVKI